MRDKNELATPRKAKKIKIYHFGGGVL